MQNLQHSPKNFYFLAFDSAFYWVRSSTLESGVASTKGITAVKVFESHKILNQSVLCFNRFNITNYYQLLSKIATKLKIPMIFDIDDLFWDLPKFSQDFAKGGESYLSKVEKLIANCQIITTTQMQLKAAIEKRYPTKKVIIVPNAQPNWIAPRGAVLIANTDSFKFNNEDLSWFSEVFEKLISKGVPIQLIGSNSAITNQFGLSCYTSKEIDYKNYLEKINLSNFSYGLIPVSNSDYANCKSAIKLNEFLANQIKVFASAIYPYQEFKETYPKVNNLHLVENSKIAWSKVAEEIASEITQNSELCQTTLMDHAQRKLQFAGWECVIEELSKTHEGVSKNAYRKISAFNYLYLCHFSRLIRLAKFLLKPVRLIQGFIRG